MVMSIFTDHNQLEYYSANPHPTKNVTHASGEVMHVYVTYDQNMPFEHVWFWLLFIFIYFEETIIQKYGRYLHSVVFVF